MDASASAVEEPARGRLASSIGSDGCDDEGLAEGVTSVCVDEVEDGGGLDAETSE